MSGKYALVIGNSEYEDIRLAQLTAPGKDAEDLARVLRERDYCAFDDVRVLLNQPEPMVRAAIDEFFDAKSPGDLLVLYFSGHGVKDELGALYLAVRNTNRARLRSTAIKSDFIQEAMEQCRARRQVLILDCCNSGAFQQGTKAATGGSIGVASAFGGTGRIILTASDSLQYAWQGDAVMGNTQNSLFTHYLVEGLKGEADLDGDGLITVDELYDYAYEQVQRSTPNQTPSKFSTRQEGEIVLRQITQLDQIKAAPLPDPLVESMENPIAGVRLGAVQALARLLKSRNLGLARSARDALEKLCMEDDSYSVRKAATEALAPIIAVEQEAKRREEERLAAEEAETERLAAEKAKADQERLKLEEVGDTTTVAWKTGGLEQAPAIERLPQAESGHRRKRALQFGAGAVVLFIVVVIALLARSIYNRSQQDTADATATAKAAASYAQIALSRDNLIYRPSGGKLEHDTSAKSIRFVWAGTSVRDFAVRARFSNPYATSTGPWDYGFLFGDHLHLVVTSGKKWLLEAWDLSSKSYVLTAWGDLPNLDVSASGTNDILLICNGNHAKLYVRSNYISDMDLSSHATSGDVAVFTGFFLRDQVDGYSTPYQDFEVWRLP